MGNRWGAVELINPVEFPYLDIERDAQGGYKYISSVGRFLTIAILQAGDCAIDKVQILESTAVELLPPIEKVPPEEIRVRGHIEQVIGKFFRNNGLSELERHSGANRLRFTNGSKWGMYPGSRIIQGLEEEGYTFDRTFYHSGRNKRIETYAAAFQSPSK